MMNKIPAIHKLRERVENSFSFCYNKLGDFMVYTSCNNEKIKNLRKLKEKKYRDKMGLFLVEGEHLINEAYHSHVLNEIILLEGMKSNIDVPISYATKEVISSLTDVESPSNMIGICHKKEETEYHDKIVILDDIQDPGNLGTIIRSAVAFHVDTIVISEKTVDLYNPKVIRASQGMIFKINIIRTNLEMFIQNLKQEHYKILTTQVNGGKNIKNLEKIEKVAIIMGNEGNGVCQDILKLSDELIYIPMSKQCESLNVAIATSIILYELWSE